MNTKQLTAIWFGILLLSGGLWWFASDAGRVAVLVAFAILVGIWVAGFVYSFSEHNQADNRKVALSVAGPTGAVIIIISAIALYPEYSDWLAEEGTSNSYEGSIVQPVKRTFEEFVEQRELQELADSFPVTILGTDSAGRSLCPIAFRSEANYGDSCLRVTARIRNNSSRTLREFTLWAEITDTLGNQVDHGGVRTYTRVAPGEDGVFDLELNALAEYGENREISLVVWRPEFVQ